MYNYEKQKPELFTDEGQRMLLKVRDKAFELIDLAGAVRWDKAVAGCTGDSWTMIACMDRLVEIGDLKRITSVNVAGQHQIFVKS